MSSAGAWSVVVSGIVTYLSAVLPEWPKDGSMADIRDSVLAQWGDPILLAAFVSLSVLYFMIAATVSLALDQ
jgi:hypothetical protein